ncbi:hypothetical protein BABINDRAFT_162582 [Babjeviella inositovora NRRL Y-12698]|uniref:Peptide transporter PTR2 n=1 Tax=Babjeviella inositovora NRRL Y-12698 TaxID=984486 RepID=A0A1E3QPC2_9ASCO|nr:uncharacterized protein BABINDRAFT_162582 [Babjeviella inositovora NRRL Y-12698]ODQ78922.1 hypothetical protein BABINDRAFT_162582 [Babjeviella inositovora NRRL Y-12698]
MDLKEKIDEKSNEHNGIEVQSAEDSNDLGMVYANGDGFEEEEGRMPTDEEMKTLRHISEKIPLSCWLVAIVELCERFSYYGLSGPFQNYMQNSPTDTPPGILNLGNSGATALSYFFQFWCYITPIFGAWIADSFWGKYKTIFVFCIIYFFGIFILFITSVPSITSPSVALGGYATAIVIIGIGTGGVKSNVSPLIADQIPKTSPRIHIIPKTGERVILDPAVTIQNVFLFFYLMINVGSLSVIATTELEMHKGFWAAYLLPLCFFVVGITVLVIGRNKYVKTPPSSTVIADSFHIMWIGVRNKFSFDAAKPSNSPDKNYHWNDHFVEEVKRAMIACKVFCFYPIYWVVYGQMLNNFVSQAGQMELHGLPNDILQAIDSIAIIVFIPIFEHFAYPFIRRFTPFRAITRITLGFFFGAAAMAYAGVLQHYIYKAGPCYTFPSQCAASDNGKIPNHINIALQVPAYVLIAISEILASITGLEYAYTKAPSSMKSFIMSMYLLTTAFGSALGIALSPTSENPKLVWTYTGLSVSCFIAGVCFWLCFHHYNKQEVKLNALEYNKESAEGVKNSDAQDAENDIMPMISPKSF